MAQRWLVVRGGALGDFILTLPALEALRALGGEVRLVANPRFARLRPDLYDELVDIHGLGALPLFGEGPLPWPVDAAVVYTPTVAARLRALGVPVRAGPPQPPPGVHAQDALLEPILALYGEASPPVGPPRLWPSPAALGAVGGLLGAPPVVLAPGASAIGKRWPGMEALAVALQARGLETVWAGPLDEGPPPRLSGRRLLGAPLEQLVALAHRCALWIGNDTGTSHLAAAAGAPTWAFFGPTDPACWLPRGARALPMAMSVEDVENDVVLGGFGGGPAPSGPGRN